MADRYANHPRQRAVRKALRRDATPAERCLWRIVRARRLAGIKFRRQHRIGRYVVDFYSPAARLAVELDGSVHDDPLRSEYDGVRQRYLESLGIRVVRFSNQEVISTPDVVATALREGVAERI